MWYKQHEQTITLTIAARPNAKNTEFKGIHNDALCVNIKGRAVDGVANKELIRFLAEYFFISQKCIRLIRGGHARIKIIELPTNEMLIDFIAAISRDSKQPL